MYVILYTVGLHIYHIISCCSIKASPHHHLCSKSTELHRLSGHRPLFEDSLEALQAGHDLLEGMAKADPQPLQHPGLIVAPEHQHLRVSRHRKSRGASDVKLERLCALQIRGKLRDVLSGLPWRGSKRAS